MDTLGSRDSLPRFVHGSPPTYLYNYLPTYAPTFLLIHYAYLPIYVMYITKYLITYLLIFSNPTPPILPINLLKFALIHG